jgi:C-terminal processing protease CtpA/Prc
MNMKTQIGILFLSCVIIIQCFAADGWDDNKADGIAKDFVAGFRVKNASLIVKHISSNYQYEKGVTRDTIKERFRYLCAARDSFQGVYLGCISLDNGNKVLKFNIENAGKGSHDPLLQIDAMIDSSYEIIKFIDPAENLDQMRKQFQSAYMAASPYGVLTEAQKAMGFMKMWTTVSNNFSNFDQVPQINWESVFYEYYPQVLAAKDISSYYKNLQKCLSLLRDGHTIVGYPHDAATPGVLLNMVEGKLVIVDFIENDETKKAALLRGEEMTSIDGRNALKVLANEVLPYYPRSTSQDIDNALVQMLWGAPSTTVQLGIRDRVGKIRTVVLTRAPEGYIFPWNNRPHVASHWLPDSILHVTLNDFACDSIFARFDSIYKSQIIAAKGIILDVRENTYGYNRIGLPLVSYFIDKNISAERIRSRRIVPMYSGSGGGTQGWQIDTVFIRPQDKKHFGGPVVVLQGPHTVGAAEEFVVALQANKLAVVVGEKSAGSAGTILPAILPGGGILNVNVSRCEYPDGKGFVGIGVSPDVEISTTQKNISDSEDPVLKKGLEVLLRIAKKTTADSYSNTFEKQRRKM